MKYFLLPKLPHSFQTALDVKIVSAEDTGCQQDNNVVISHSLCYFLYNIKNEIDEYKKEWDVYKTYTNPYEHVHVPVMNKEQNADTCSCVGNYRPLSRSFYKMVELLSFFRCGSIFGKEAIRTFHLAEGPGGFIEAVTYFRESRFPGDEYIGMTLVKPLVGQDHVKGSSSSSSSSSNIPSWKKSKQFLKLNPKVKIEYGTDQTGNLLSLSNFEGCYQKYKSSMDFITADGGFDFSGNYNKQELSISSLLFSQIAYAVVCQKRKGSFILKIFDVFHQSTVDLIAYLSSLYENVYVTKPNMSRYVNSEKYLVCMHFLPYSREVREQLYPQLHASLKSLLAQKVHFQDNPYYAQRYLHARKVEIPLFFLTKLREVNSIIGQQQIEKIYFTLVLIKTRSKNDEKIKSLIAKNKEKCIQWCKFHQLQINSWLG